MARSAARTRAQPATAQPARATAAAKRGTAAKAAKAGPTAKPARGRKAVLRHMAEVLWENPPAHSPGALSKMLVRPETAGSRLVDFRVSSYQPMAYVEPHAHKVQEQIYHVLEGEGLMELDGQREVVRPGNVIFIPPGVRHAIYNTGQGDLIFFVITTPPDDK